MKIEDKQLLLQDLCARLPYGVKISVDNKVESLQGINISDNVVEYDSFLSSDIEEVKPYLFSLSSMTEEQIEELKELCHMYTPYDYKGNKVLYKQTLDDNYEFNFTIDVINWFHKNHIDYRGLIPMGLAIDATNKNIY